VLGGAVDLGCGGKRDEQGYQCKECSHAR
jgi:hypothetical protein